MQYYQCVIAIAEKGTGYHKLLGIFLKNFRTHL